jgi:hypothetical protein
MMASEKASILTLGDGNFSFSMALSQLLCGSDAHLVATSFDSSDEVKVCFQ